MIETLISSKTRIKLLFKFFLNSNNTAYLRSLEQEFGESTNAIRVELNRLEKAGMLISFTQGNKKVFQANQKHPLFDEIHNILRKHIGFDTIIENVISRLGEVKKVFVLGSLANGMDSGEVDLLLVGTVDEAYLLRLIDKAQGLISKKILCSVISEIEYLDKASKNGFSESLLIWADE
jgi:hypothetical protein